MTKWFIQRAGSSEDLGPYRPSELLEMVRSGEVTSETMLRKDNSKWFAAADVGGLFEAAMRPTIRYFCPHCHTEINEPPVMCPKCDANVVRAKTLIKENTIVSRTDHGTHEATSNSVKNWLNRKKLGRDMKDSP